MVSAPTPQVRPQERIVAVVVTYNRRELLEQTLAGIEAGELTPDTVIIVNNASTDGTEEYLGSYRSSLATDIVHLPQNVGGAGGFTVGIDRAPKPPCSRPGLGHGRRHRTYREHPL